MERRLNRRPRPMIAPVAALPGRTWNPAPPRQDIGFEVGQPRTSDEMSKSLRADYERVGAMLKAINFKPE